MVWLLTWLGHGLMLASLAYVALRMQRRMHAASRYLVWWAALVGLLVLGWTDWPRIPVSPPAVQAAAFPWRIFPLAFPAVPGWAKTGLLGVWIVGVMIGLARLARGVVRVRAIQRECYMMPAAHEDRLPMWSRARGNGRRTRLMLCDAVAVPSAIGLARPVIIVPPALLDVMTDDDLDQVVLHEYAHVQRWDDWARLAQSMIEAVCFFHPAVRWTGRFLNIEREVACDELVIARTGAPKNYARCLMQIAEWASGQAMPTGVLAIHSSQSSLAQRVDRLLNLHGGGAGRMRSRITAGVGIGAIGAAVFNLALLPLVTERGAVAAEAVQTAVVVMSPDVHTPRPAVIPREPVIPGLGREQPRIDEPGTAEASLAEGESAEAESTDADSMEVDATQRDSAAPFLPSLRATPQVEDAVASLSMDSGPGIGKIELALAESTARPDVDSVSTWAKAAGVGAAAGAGAQAVGLAVGRTFTRFGLGIARGF